MTATQPPESAGFTSLMRKAQAGDSRAFVELIEPHGGALQREAERCLDSKLRALVTADDVVQETRIRAFRGLAAARFENPGQLGGWLHTIQARVCHDLARRHRPQLRQTSLDGDTAQTASGTIARLVDLVPGKERTPSSAAAREERALRLEHLLVGLSAEQRAVLRMMCFEHLPSAAVAERLGKSPDAVRKVLQRALESCREAARRMGWDRE